MNMEHHAKCKLMSSVPKLGGVEGKATQMVQEYS